MRLPSALPALLAVVGLAVEAAAEASGRLRAAVGADASVLLRREASWLSANMSAGLQDLVGLEAAEKAYLMSNFSDMGGYEGTSVALAASLRRHRKKKAPKPKEVLKKKAPTKSAPKEKAPIKIAPKRKAPTKKAPTKEAPTKEAPTKKAPTKRAPRKKALTKKAPSKTAPRKSVPTKSAPVNSAPTKGGTRIHYRFDETKGYTTAGWNTGGTMQTVDGKVHGPIGGKFTLQKTFRHLPSHTKVRVEMRYYALETWDSGEAAVVKVDGETIFRGIPRENPKSCMAPFHDFNGHFQSARQKCYADVVGVSVHTASSLTLAVSCSLDSEWQDEFAAIGRLRIALEEKCHEGVCEAGSVLKDPPPTTFGPTSSVCCDEMCEEKKHCPRREGKSLKEPGSTKACPEGHCTVEFCCRQAGACHPMLCQGSKLLKVNQPDHCAGVHCTVAECCEDAPTCDPWLCSWRGRALKAPPPPHCLTHNCTLDECCGGPAPAPAAAPGPAPSRTPTKSGAGRGCLPAGLLLLGLAGALRAWGPGAG